MTTNSRSPASPSPGLVNVRGTVAAYLRRFPNLIQQRRSAFAVGVGKPQKPAKPVSVFHRIEPKFSGQSSMRNRSFDSLHLSVVSRLVIP